MPATTRTKAELLLLCAKDALQHPDEAERFRALLELRGLLNGFDPLELYVSVEEHLYREEQKLSEDARQAIRADAEPGFEFSDELMNEKELLSDR